VSDCFLSCGVGGIKCKSCVWLDLEAVPPVCVFSKNYGRVVDFDECVARLRTFVESGGSSGGVLPFLAEGRKKVLLDV